MPALFSVLVLFTSGPPIPDALLIKTHAIASALRPDSLKADTVE